MLTIKPLLSYTSISLYPKGNNVGLAMGDGKIFPEILQIEHPEIVYRFDGKTLFV
jgi:hypothetical protein